MNKYLGISLTLLLLGILLLGCPENIEYPVITDPRTFVIDVENALFDAADVTDFWERGLGLDSLTLTVITQDAAGAEVPVVQAVAASDLVPLYAYTRFALSITGILLRVEASGRTAAGTAYTTTISDKAAAEVWEGWTVFANCLKVKLGFSLDYTDTANSTLLYRVAPLGGSCALLAYDAGVQTAGTGFTDRASVLTAKQIAFRPQLQENPTGLTYDVYTLIIAENISELYNENTNLGAYYTDMPWSPLWTYAEITTNGRNVAGKVYTPAKANTTPCNILDPSGDGFESYLIDLTAATDTALTDKFMLIGIILHCGDLSVPAKMICVDIQ